MKAALAAVLCVPTSTQYAKIAAQYAAIAWWSLSANAARKHAAPRSRTPRWASRRTSPPTSPLSALVDRRVRAIVEWLDQPEHRRRFDEWVRTMSQELLRRHHHQIGRTVRDYLDNLKDAELVERIEARVGADLQYIRLNGAVIGGLVGVLLAVLHTFFGH